MDTKSLFVRFASDVRSDGGLFFVSGRYPALPPEGLELIRDTLNAVRSRCRESGGGYFIHYSAVQRGGTSFASIRFPLEGCIEYDLPGLERRAESAGVWLRFSYSPGCARINIAC